MDYLPIKYLRVEDKDRVEEWLIKLSTLSRNGIPILEGVVFFPPNFKEAFKKFFIVDEVSFKNRKKDIKKYFKDPPSFFIEEIEKYDKKIEYLSLWNKIIDEWLNNFEKSCKAGEFSLNNLGTLKGTPIFFAKKILASGTVNVVKDFTFKDNPFDTKIKIEKGKLESKNLKELDLLAIKAEKILGLGFSFRWVLEEVDHEKKIFFTSIFHSGLLPNSVNNLNNKTYYIPFKERESETRLPVKVFIFINQLEEEVPDLLDGVIVDTSFFKEDRGLKTIINFCEKFKDSLVLFKFTDEDLMSSKKLKKKCEDLLFLRNKKRLLSVVPVIPSSSSVDEFLKTKRDLAVFGISRKASLKLWAQFKSPSNIIDIESYALAGIDGVVLNLDLTFKSFFTLEDFHNISREKVETFIKFLDEGLVTLNKLNIPVVALGELIDNDEILKYLISKGVWGIAVSAKRHQIFLMDLPWVHLQAQRNLLS